MHRLDSSPQPQKYRNGDSACPPDCLLTQAVTRLPIGLVLTGNSGRIVWLNPAAEELLAIRSSECVGRPLDQIRMDPVLSAFCRDAVDARGEHTAALSVRYPHERELKVAYAVAKSNAGAETGHALLLSDITAERRVRIELSQAVTQRLLDLTSGHMPPEPVKNLTQQELRILRLVGRGLGNDEIAVETSISASTVRSHMKSLYRKLNLGSRAEAVSFAVRNHLV